MSTPTPVATPAAQSCPIASDILFDQLPTPAYVCDEQGRIVRCNRQAIELWGRRPRMQDDADRFCGSHRLHWPNGQRMSHADSPMAAALLSGEVAGNREIVIERPNGERVAALVRINLLREAEGGLAGAAGCFEVIEERRELDLQESERRSRELLEALPAAIYTTDRDGAITFYNEAAARLWGVRPELGTSYWCGSWRLFWPDGTPVPHDQCPMAIALKENRVVRNVEAIAERPDGTRVPFMPYPTPLHDADHRLVGAVNMLIDLTHLKQVDRRQQLLINELNHRVKNTLATIQSIAHQTFAGKTDEELKQRFEKRLIALAKTHDILTREDWRGADMRELISQSIEFACDAGERATVDGPSVLLPQRAVVPMAMAIHELCTNASKYGALTDPAGRIVIEWQLMESGARLQLRWAESGGPPVQTPTRRGFGTRLLERGLTHELRAECKLTFQPSGVLFEINMPLPTT